MNIFYRKANQGKYIRLLRYLLIASICCLLLWTISLIDRMQSLDTIKEQFPFQLTHRFQNAFDVSKISITTEVESPLDVLFNVTSALTEVTDNGTQTKSIISNSTTVTSKRATEQMAQTSSKQPNVHRLPLLMRFVLADDRCDDPSNVNASAMAQPTVVDDEKIVVSCDEIHRRGYYPNNTHDESYSIAFVRVVYKDYHLQELLFNLMYSPINTYCYSIDKKATKIFHEQMRNLSKCFSNVYISTAEYSVDSAGHNMDRSFLECLKILRKLPDWKYAITLQNHDIPLKTNREMIMILKALNGSNNVELIPPMKNRIPKFNDWSFRALGLFKDSKKNDNRTLNIGKGNTANALSRPFVEFIVDKLNLTTLLQRFDMIQYGGDEYVIPSLNSEDALDAPGGYTMKCMHVDTSFVMRYTVWNKRPCYSKRYRHGICVFGIKDLKLLRGLRCLFGNKMVPEIDYGVISCWAKELHDRTHHQQNHTVDLNFYPNIRTVVFNKEKQKWRSNMKAFNCTG